MKLYFRIKSLDDCLRLQDDLESFSLWVNVLGWELNLSKCHKMTFTRCQSSIMFPYTFNGSILHFTGQTVHDLGLTFAPFLNPKSRINTIICKSLESLGFIKSIASELKHSNSIELLYCALVRPILEYGSVIRDPRRDTDRYTLERVQRKFLSFASYKLNVTCPPHDYSPVLLELNLISSIVDTILSLYSSNDFYLVLSFSYTPLTH